MHDLQTELLTINLKCEVVCLINGVFFVSPSVFLSMCNVDYVLTEVAKLMPVGRVCSAMTNGHLVATIFAYINFQWV